MHTEPLTCYRPAPDAARDFASLPYDVFDTEEARTYLAAHPRSFLAIDRAETGFEPGHDPYADDVYERAAALLAGRIADGTLVADDVPCYYLYRLEQGGRSQTGVVAACATDDYATGAIRRHELTRPEKERDRVRHVRALGCQTGPVFLVHRDDEALAALVRAHKRSEPLYDFTDGEGVRQTVWRVDEPEAVGALREALGRVPRAYIADGHHRAASAARVCEELRQEHPGAAGAPYEGFLAVLFPESQLRVLPYNRVVLDTNGLGEEELVARVREAGFVVGPRQGAPIAPATRGHFGMYAFGAWRALELEGPRPVGVVERLDVQILQERVLGPVLGVDDPRTSRRIRFVGGIEGTVGLERRAGQGGVGLSLCATSVGELMDVADAGLLMPPKSTWFEPKLRSGLFVRRIAPAGA